MQIQANSCAEKEMEQEEHPWFIAQKGNVQLKHIWVPLNSVNLQCQLLQCLLCLGTHTLCFGVAGVQGGNLSQGYKFMHSAYLLLCGIQDYLCFSG